MGLLDKILMGLLMGGLPNETYDESKEERRRLLIEKEDKDRQERDRIVAEQKERVDRNSFY